MTMDLAVAHRRALAETERIVTGIGAEQWALISNCDAWDVRALLNHVVTGNWWAVELSGGKTIAEVGDRLDGDVLGDDPLAAYRASADATASAFEAPGVMDTPCAVSYGPVPGSVYAGHRFIDVLIHGWDLAHSTGQDETLDPELVEECWAVFEPQAAMLQGSGAFGHAHDVSGSRQAQLLAALGR
jgi:uncharacterized protein (TIGR03086 family)